MKGFPTRDCIVAEALIVQGQQSGPRGGYTMAKGTLIAAMNIGKASEDEFHDWYDTEHLPERQRVPGFLVCQRWIGADDRKVSVATYDLHDLSVLKSPAYQAIGGGDPSPRAQRGTAPGGRVVRFHGGPVLPGGP